MFVFYDKIQIHVTLLSNLGMVNPSVEEEIPGDIRVVLCITGIGQGHGASTWLDGSSGHHMLTTGVTHFEVGYFGKGQGTWHLNYGSIPSLDDIVRQGKVDVNPEGFPLQEILGNGLAVTRGGINTCHHIGYCLNVWRLSNEFI